MSEARRELVEASILSARIAGEGGRGRLRAKERDVRGVRGARAVEAAGWASESELFSFALVLMWQRKRVPFLSTYGASVSSRAPRVCRRARCGLLVSSLLVIRVEPVSRFTGESTACRR